MYALIFVLFSIGFNKADNVSYIYEADVIEIVSKKIQHHTSEDIWLIAKLVQSEAANQSDLGQQYVAEVVINRAVMKSLSYKDVIYAKGQFDGINNKYFKKDPSRKCVTNTLAAFYNPKLPSNVVYFANEEISTDRKWIKKLQKQKYVKEGDHTFYFKPVK